VTDEDLRLGSAKGLGHFSTGPAPAETQAMGGIAAFFDMDHTVLSASSGRLYVKYLMQTGRLSWWRWANISRFIAAYALGFIDFPYLMSRLMLYAADEDEAATWRLSERWFQEMLRHHIAPAACDRIAGHRKKGHHVAIVSAATPYAVKMVAEAVGCGSAYLATRLEVMDGKFTGALVEPACYGAGKVTLARAYAADHGIDLALSYFYTDSESDLPLLEAVGNPIAVNPSRKLRNIATTRGWPIVRFY
jgi:putative phosphoserine phosphatase / 1-acylglycerol-3-phosphate O-acyltransferase